MKITAKILFAVKILFLVSAQQPDAQPNYSRDFLSAVLWQQNSGEYKALCYQAFNAGKSYLESLNLNSKKAIVMDIDETALDNSPYAAWMVTTGNPWSNESWEKWCNAEEAKAVPGAVEFADYAKEKGIEVFYVSNRPVSVFKATIANLKDAGFPFADNQHVLLMDVTSDKTPRMNLIKDNGFEIILIAGDNLDDFDSKIRKWINKERAQWADNEKLNFGVKYIMLPNPVYGTFESAIIQGYYKLSPLEKSDSRLKAINSWKP